MNQWEGSPRKSGPAEPKHATVSETPFNETFDHLHRLQHHHRHHPPATAALPLTVELLRQLKANKSIENLQERRSSILPPTVTAEDVLDFDGSGLATARAREGSAGDVRAAIFFNSLDAHYLDVIEKNDAELGTERLFLLVNPGWKDKDPLSSWGFNLLQPRAKQRAEALIFGRVREYRYDVTYSCQRCTLSSDHFCVSIKAFPYDWQMFAYHLPERLEYEGCAPVFLGESAEQPKESELQRLIDAHPEFQDAGVR